MRTIFLADAHLSMPTDRNYRVLLQFLRELEGNTAALFVMGDLFDFWLGFSSRPFRQYDVVLAALHTLVRSGCRLIYFEGNHDFHLGTVFRDELGAEIHTGPAIQTVQGRRLFLCHGDEINSADRGYRFLRRLLHNRLAATAVRYVPPLLALRLKDILQQRSRSGYRAKVARWNYRDIIRGFAGSLREQGCDGLVCGHFHLGFSEELEGTRFTILSLGDWMERFTYGEVVAGELLLKSYTPEE